MMSSRVNSIVYGGAMLVVVVVLLAVGWYVHTRAVEREGGSRSTTHTVGAISAATYTDIDGNAVSLDAYAGRVLVVNAWASWCPFCVHELPMFGNLQGEFGNQIAIIAINRAEPRDTVRAFLDYVGNPRGITILLDPEDVFYKTIGGFSMPETQVYDRAGNLIAHRRGALSIEDMRPIIMEALSR